ncbi:MAG: AbrB/MazE/SpoVT family DNA-binding domain-containing protein [Gorillibacterium sp.]|nr:AbrB/MazE/SpoVT family DNA-binding domain-containing protein [Gorillibacterium sp.]
MSQLQTAASVEAREGGALKSTGIVRRIDDLGRIVIPKELRRTLGIKEGDPLEIGVDQDKIVLWKYLPSGTAAVSLTAEELDRLQLLLIGVPAPDLYAKLEDARERIYPCPT